MKDWCLEVWGDYACFTRPEMKVERVSYNVMTPSAARAIFEAVLWKPAIRWNITKIEVLKPIKWVNVRRNEIAKKFAKPSSKLLEGQTTEPLNIYIENERQQRAGLFLKDVRYRIHGYFDFIPPELKEIEKSKANGIWADNEEERNAKSTEETPAKYAAMFERRAKRGQCFHRPYLGCREFSCHFRLVEPEEIDPKPKAISEKLGWMLYDMDFSDPKNPMPMFFDAKLENGVVITDRRKIEVRK